jgi:sensor histidine kinase regulating citrate/malate metabolism
MNVYVFFFLRNEINRKIEQKRHALLINHAEELTELYNQSCLDREEQARNTHEYKNVMYAIEGLLTAGKYKEAEAYVRARNEEFAKVTNIVNTGNAVVNAVFNTKYAEAKRKGINVRFSIGDLSDVELEYTDLVTVLANLLNNSIEACEKCEADNRIIDVVIKPINDSEFMISIKNTYNGIIQKQNGQYLTTKVDKVNHGFGLENVRSVVSKLNGYMDIDNNNGSFTVTIVVTNR